MQRKPINVRCICDGCGETTECDDDEPAPKGWFYCPLADNSNTHVLACSVQCKELPWKKYAGRRKK